MWVLRLSAYETPMPTAPIPIESATSATARRLSIDPSALACAGAYEAGAGETNGVCGGGAVLTGKSGVTSATGMPKRLAEAAGEPTEAGIPLRASSGAAGADAASPVSWA